MKINKNTVTKTELSGKHTLSILHAFCFNLKHHQYNEINFCLHENKYSC